MEGREILTGYNVSPETRLFAGSFAISKLAVFLSGIKIIDLMVELKAIPNDIENILLEGIIF